MLRRLGSSPSIASVRYLLCSFDREDSLNAYTYSTVTVFARLRGWSTFRPRLRAIS